jgi:hypothetical protein
MPFLQFIDPFSFVSKIASASLALLSQEIDAWQTHCNHHPASIDWHFTTSKARLKLKRLYPNL